MNKNYRIFYEEVGGKYPEEAAVYATLRGILRKRFIISKLNLFKGLLLDAGCNVGTYCAVYDSGPVVGIDVASAVLKKAKKRIPEGLFIKGDLEELGFIKEGVVDNILCTEVLEHLREPQKAIQWFYRALRGSGRLLLTTPNYRKKRPPSWVNLGILKNYGIKGQRGDKYFHTAFRPEELEEMVVKVGFKVEELGTLEKPVKYCAKVPLLFSKTSELLNNFVFKSQSLSTFNEKIFNKLSLMIYKGLDFLRMNPLLERLVKEGVRSYIIARK